MISFLSYEECILHLKQLVSLNNHCFPNSGWGEETWKNILTKGNFITVICQQDGKILAYLLITYLLNEAELYKIGVWEANRNQGIAQQLLNTACHQLENHSIEQLFLEVRADNMPAIRFYQKNDFEIVKTRKKYYHNPKCDGLLLKKYLT